MAWTYDASALGTSTAAERLNAVRLLIGDTDTNDQQVQDEEITFALSENGNNVYYAGSWACRVIAAKYSRYVNTDLDGQLSEDFSDLQKHYTKLAQTLEFQGKKVSGALNVAAGGILKTDLETALEESNRVQPRIRRDQFLYDNSDYDQDYT